MVASNSFGRQVVVPLTNKSGGGVIAGDVVIVDSSNNDAFTTTTTSAYTKSIGIAQETIASNATGRVLVAGYAALVNVNASVTRGDYGATHTVVKQATDAGASRIAGTFCVFLTGGTTPDAFIWQPDLGGGSGMTNPMTTAGDLIYSSDGSGTPARLASAGATTKFLRGANGAAPTWQLPPGYEFDYVEFTANVNVTATTEGSADTVVAGTSLTYLNVPYNIEFYSPAVKTANTANAELYLLLYEDSTLLGYMAGVITPAANGNDRPVLVRRKRTPSAATHVYTVKAIVSSGTGVVKAGSGGTGAFLPGYIRVSIA